MISVRPDAIFTDGKFYTMDPDRRVVEAIAVKSGRILATGTRAEIEALAHPACERHSLGGRTVIPGLIDSHLHLLSFGQFLDRIPLAGTNSIAELKARVKGKVETMPPGAWVLGRGWEQDRFIEKRYPTRWDLDEVAPSNPVVLTRACGHVSVVNSQALRIAGLETSAPDYPGGVFDKDANGVPTGIVRERAMDLIRQKMPEPTYDELKACLRNAIRAAQKAGITSIHTNDGAGLDYDVIPKLYRDLYDEGERLRVYWDIPSAYIDQVLSGPSRTGSGDEYFKYGSMKLFVDGSLGARTAALEGEYADDPGNNGVLVVSPEQLDEMVERCHQAGMQVAIHAIGDRGVRLALNAIEKAQKALPRKGPRHRIVHCQVMTPDLYRRFRELGVVADIQPKFVTTDMQWTEARVGAQKASTSYAWKMFFDLGVAAAGGSDCPVEPIDPMYGIYAAVTRCDMEGNPPGGWMPEHKLSLDQALSLFTHGGAYAAFEEDIKGSLEAGKVADFVVLDRDIYSVCPMEIKDIKVVMTCVGGRIVYQQD